MRMRNQRSSNRLKSSRQRLEEIKVDVKRIQSATLKRRASVRSDQERIEAISVSLDEILKQQEQTLEQLKKLAYAK